ncbi:nodulation protein NfeD [Pseudomonadota bacterium]
MSKLRYMLLIVVMVAIAGVGMSRVSAERTDGVVSLLTIDGAIGPATHDYIERALENAIKHHAQLIVIRLDTPGGLDASMRGIIKNITNSSVPVITYVAPSGARATSAGTYILYASHIAAMAPGTNLGAATPVRIGGIPSPSSIPNKKDKHEGEQPAVESNQYSLKRKSVNDAVAYIQSLAQLRGRNADWAEKAVREAASLTADEAIKINVIDIVASSLPDLLKQLDGREVMIKGEPFTLQTTGLVVDELAPDWRNQLLSIITNPNVAYILMLIGIYGLIFEFSNPGAIIPGTVGAISLLLALYAFQLLPISYAGVALIFLGIALMVAEAFEPSFGVLGLGGITAFVIGSIILMDTDAPGFGIDLAVIVIFAITSALVFILAIGMAIKARRRPVVSGVEELIGGVAQVMDDFDEKGRVNIHSESWNALCHTPLRKGQQVIVTGIDGLTLEVEPLNDAEAVKQESKKELNS